LSLVATGRIDLTPLVTHSFSLDAIKDAYELFSRQGDGVLKVSLFPGGIVDKVPQREAVDAVC